MATTLDETQRQAIASRLATLKAIQNLVISNEQTLSAIGDTDIRDRLQDMLRDDQKNLQVIEDSISKLGVSAEAPEKVHKLVETVQNLMTGDELSPYEKVFEHEKLKHQQAMTGLLVHKAAQVVGEDLEEAIGPLNQVNFENRAHQEQLKGVLEILSTRELVGKDPDQGVWGRVQDAVSALRGVFGSAAS
ncbi:hemerythrin HHE cation-binding protein [Gloeocapsopsis sp. IPPAS B-1203]|uniref:hemerythrin HHE cation-binding protein n=1 Tax=Gloeocapsopsis sp. IPPAS B-1203 TaxID=2049454 RepID=UPI000C19ECC6|nr:hemerythrin HHE cation-binding protein [Gloeocapsopsis sp. IPPAS B-1203]PIG94683.1 hemerythrin HHE cation-binding protein [Gloeocapsopsis sp. IPPAS B-1203]